MKHQPLSQQIRIAAISLLLLLLVGVACGNQNDEPSGDDGGEELSVVATTTHIADMTRNVVGDRASVQSLLPANADAHDFEPTPRDVETVADADLILTHGLGLDAWAEGIVEQADSDVDSVVVTEGIATEAGAGEEHDEHEDEDQDAHVWFDVVNAKLMVENIRDALIAADPDGKAEYEDNASAYLARLDELDGWIREQIASIPEANRKLVTNHDAFGYYVRAYGLKFVGSIIPSLDTQAQPSAQETAELIDRIRAEGVKAIFTEASINADLARQLAEEAGVEVVDDLYGDSLGPEDSGAETYIDMMRSNTTKIVEALK